MEKHHQFLHLLPNRAEQHRLRALHHDFEVEASCRDVRSCEVHIVDFVEAYVQRGLVHVDEALLQRIEPPACLAKGAGDGRRAGGADEVAGHDDLRVDEMAEELGDDLVDEPIHLDVELSAVLLVELLAEN